MPTRRVLSSLPAAARLCAGKLAGPFLEPAKMAMDPIKRPLEIGAFFGAAPDASDHCRAKI